MYGKHGLEIRIWSVGQDISQSWVRISSGTNKYVVDSIHNNTEVPANPHEEQASQSSVKVIAARSKAKAKPQKREPVHTPTIIPMHERNKWIDIEPSEPFSLCVRSLEESDQSASTKSNSTARRRWVFSSGELSFIFEINPHKYSIGQMGVGKRAWQQEEVQKEDISIALIIQEQFCTSVLYSDTPDVISLILCYKTM